MKKHLSFAVIGICICLISKAQENIEVKAIIDTLTSTNLYGRGYVNNGISKTEFFLKNKFRSMGLIPLTENYSQSFSFPVNTFPGKMSVSINNIDLKPGENFIVGPESVGISEKGTLVMRDSNTYINEKQRIIVKLESKLTWSVATEVANYTIIHVDKNAIKGELHSFKINIENKFVPDFKSSNIVGKIPGTSKPDSTIYITAHYDHLGGMGNKTYFPGANDNASGTALLLSLAKYYSTHPPAYTMVFICFAGEEAGLIGSKYYTEHPLTDLKQIKFLVNIDLVGTGDEGITVVNGSVYPEAFHKLESLNNQFKYLSKVNTRAKAANSDHYWFTEKGVPAFFIYTLGGIKAYHDIYDRAATLPLTEFNDLQKLLINFSDSLMN